MTPTENKRNIETAYKLSPMQQGMLFHSIYNPESAVYFEQMCVTLQGTIDIPAFQKAWQQVVDRHSILRSAFTWKNLDRMLQIVYKSVTVPFEILDWTDFSPIEQKIRLEEYLRQDRAAGFNLTKAPLMRLALIKAAPDRSFFIWSHHHLLLDGWSNAIILKEVFSLYEAFKQGKNPSLPFPRPFKEYITWLYKQDPGAAAGYWQKAVQGFADPTPLVVDQVQSNQDLPQESARVAQLTRYIPAGTTAQLTGLAKKLGITQNTLFQAAWAMLLYRYSGEEDICFGSTVSGRPAELPGAEEMVGIFINTLPVRMKIDPALPVRTLLQQLQVQLAEMRQYEYSALVEIQGFSEVPRYQSLFESIAVFENFPLDSKMMSEMAGLQVGEIKSYTETNFPLTVVSGPGERFPLQIYYNTARFTQPAIDRMLGHLQALLEGIAQNPDLPIGKLSILTPEEQEQILGNWNQTGRQFPSEKCVHDLFEEYAAAHPDALALRFEGKSLTYAELEQRANQLAHYLQSAGVRADTLVGICVERSFDMVVAVLAVNKAGGAFIPLDPAYPPDRLAFMASDSAFPVLLTQTSLAGKFSEYPGRVICLDLEWPQIQSEPVRKPDCQAVPENLAYVIYTSGSTGRPKGSLLQHRGLVNFACDYARQVGLQSGSIVLQFSTFSFDASVCEIYSTLISGATLVLARRETLMSDSELARLINREKITHGLLPPSMLRVLSPEKVPGFKTVISGGEACSPEIVAAWKPNRTFINAYGPTEITVAATMGEIEEINPATRIVPIGRPIANTQAYILGPNLQPVPVGVPGELCIGGAGLARGYLNRPELTAEKFIPSPFIPGERLYRTGDLVRWTEAGLIEYLGRTDQQVKVRGYRIELGEVENVILQHDSVRQAAVLVKGEHENRFLVAYVEPAAENVDLHQLKKYLEERLPVYMVPGLFVTLERLPLSPAGKVDRKALAKMEFGSESLPVSSTAPRTPVEQGLAELFAQLLRRPQVGIYDDFFMLGGHSLIATQLNSRIRQTFGIDLPLSTQFEYPTVAALAEQVEARLRAASGVDAGPILAAEDPSELPLSFSQQRMWFLDQLAGASPAYNIPLSLRLTGPLDILALELAFDHILRRHTVLRSKYPDVRGKPMQAINPASIFNLPLEDLTDLPDSERWASVQHCLQEDARWPFHLASGDLIKIRLLKIGPEEHILSIVLHHIIADGWSLGVLVRELTALYKTYHSGQPDPLPELPIQYTDFAAWQQRSLSGEILQRQIEYWKSELVGQTPVLELATDHPRPAVLTSNGGEVIFRLPIELTNRLTQFGREEGATLFMLLLTAYQSLLHRYTGQEHFAIGSPVANRNRSEIEPLVGMFVNTLVLKADLSGSPSFRELLKRVRTTCLGAYAHQDMPFEMLVEKLHVERDLSHTPLFQVAFGLTQAPFESFELPGLKIEPVENPAQTSKFDLTLELSEGLDGLVGSLEYNTDLFEPATAQRMVDHLIQLLDAALQSPNEPIAALPVISAGEEQKLLAWGSGAQVALPEICIHQLFESWVDQQPDALALRFENRSLTYLQLDVMANRLANRLIDSGFQKGQLAGVSFERGFDAIIASLAVLKAGGAFLPLDPRYPLDRLTFMLQDSQAAVLLTNTPILQRLGHAGPALCLDQLHADSTPPLDARPKLHLSPDDLAYVIYTSGSTGKPKGALLGHRGMVNLSLAQRQAFTVSPNSRVLQFSPLSFDASVWEMVMALGNGAALILASQEKLGSPADLLQLMQSEQVSHVTLPPSMLKVLSPADLPNLHTVVAAGEACPRELVQRWGQGRQFVNAYGPTETTVCASMYTCQLDDPADPPIGSPLPNFQLFVIDANQQIAPLGVPGELCIGGVSLARGYHNRPELTAEKFISHPYKPGAKLYRSGDLVRWRSDGQLQFLGRIDQQVKLRGFRIELGEVETALRSFPSVCDAAAHVHADRLYAYLVLQPGLDQPAISHLREHLRSSLPEYMIPSGFMFLSELPLSPSGKVDRKALPEMDGARPDLDRPYVAPHNPVEMQLAEICSELLGLERVGVEDSFFELGGHSLLATQLVSRIRDCFGVDIQLRTVFEYPSVSQLSGQIAKLKEQQSDVSKIADVLDQIQNLGDIDLQSLLSTEPQQEKMESYGD